MEELRALRNRCRCPDWQLAQDVADLYEAGGFRVDVIDLDTDWKASLDLRGDRIQIWQRDGRVVSVRQC